MSTELLEEFITERLPEPISDRFEIVDSRVVEMPAMSAYAEDVANRLNEKLILYLASHPLGRSRLDLLFRIPQADDAGRNRRPDVAFITFDRWPTAMPLPATGNGVDVVPDLAVEIVSPTDAAEDAVGKAREYLSGGVRVVWLVYPLLRELHIYDGSKTIRVVSGGDDLVGGELLPEFRVPLAELFAPVVTMTNDD